MNHMTSEAREHRGQREGTTRKEQADADLTGSVSRIRPQLGAAALPVHRMMSPPADAGQAIKGL
jgi:hypothetical protein